MRIKSTWNPRLAEGHSQPPAERLVTALAEDILEGMIDTGDRLPAHRDLADKLGLGVGTVTKAYGMLERRGLVRSVRGRGTFVALTQRRRGPLINLSHNIPPAVLSERLLARSYAKMAREVDAGLFNDYPPIGGHEEHRRVLARWFARLGMEADPSRLILTGGAHQAIAVALSVSCGTNGVLLTEAFNYPGLFALARHQRVPCVGVEMDAEGMRPEVLDRCLGTRGSIAAVVCVTPTMQNPTTATMTRARREAIVAVCRSHDVAIIEDDVYTLMPDAGLPSLAMLAPERTFYVNSLSKTLSPALRVGGLVVPSAMLEATEALLPAMSLMVPPMNGALMAQWMVDGTADEIRQSIRDESARRSAIARSLLGTSMTVTSAMNSSPGYHCWLPMPAAAARRLADAARAMGVLLTPPASMAADPDVAVSGVRLCLGAAAMDELETALAAVARLIGDVSSPAGKGVVV